jgi:hypothetical protein
MGVKEFEEAIRRFKYREPFAPFVVEKTDGALITVTHPAVVFNGESAGFLSDDDELIGFRYDEVREIRAAVPEGKV